MAINICLEMAALQLGEEGLGGMVMVTVGVGIIIKDSNGSEHGFKNRTGPAGSTGSTVNRCYIRSGSLKNPKI